MKIKYRMLDSEFNRKNYPDLIGQLVDMPPAHANVMMVKQKDTMLNLMRDTKNNNPVTIDDFINRCLKEGYEQKEIIQELVDQYQLTPEESAATFKKVIIQSKGLHKNLDKLLEKKKLGGTMSWYKQANGMDFSDVNVRRLSGILEDFQSLSRDALAEMEKWKANGENGITIEQAQERLSYYLARMGIE